MDQDIQQNAALVEEAAAAAESLQDQAGNLAQVVSVFKLDGKQTVARRSVVKSAPLVVASVPQRSEKRIQGPAVLKLSSINSTHYTGVANAHSSNGEWEEY